MRIGIYTGLLLFLFLGLTSCKLDNLEDIVVVADVEDEFYLDMWEKLNPDASKLQFRIATIKQEDCQNTFIDHRVQKSGNGLSVSLLDIERPADCDPGLAPARADVNLGAFKSGFFGVTIDLKNTVFNEGQLTVLSDRFLMKMETENGVKLVRTELLRVPENTIWGYVHYEDAQAEAEVADFLGDLTQVSREEGMKIGYYGHFTVGDSGKIDSVYNQPTEGIVKPFLFTYSGDVQQLRNLLSQHRQASGERVNFKLFTDKGLVL